MIVAILPAHDPSLSDFWVKAWQATLPDIDFEARRPWILGHLAKMREEGQVLRAYFNGEVPIGFYTLFPDSGLIEQICVNPLAKGSGIGGQLIKDAALQTPNILNLVVNADNHDARRFYEKLGFKETGRGVNSSSQRATLRLEMAAKTA